MNRRDFLRLVGLVSSGAMSVPLAVSKAKQPGMLRELKAKRERSPTLKKIKAPYGYLDFKGATIPIENFQISIESSATHFGILKMWRARMDTIANIGSWAHLGREGQAVFRWPTVENVLIGDCVLNEIQVEIDRKGHQRCSLSIIGNGELRIVHVYGGPKFRWSR